MNDAEFFGRTLRVNQSQSRIGGGANKRDAVWADGDAWNERAEADNDAAAGGGCWTRALRSRGRRSEEELRRRGNSLLLPVLPIRWRLRRPRSAENGGH